MLLTPSQSLFAEAHSRFAHVNPFAESFHDELYESVMQIDIGLGDEETRSPLLEIPGRPGVPDGRHQWQPPPAPARLESLQQAQEAPHLVQRFLVLLLPAGVGDDAAAAPAVNGALAAEQAADGDIAVHAAVG